MPFEAVILATKSQSGEQSYDPRLGGGYDGSQSTSVYNPKAANPVSINVAVQTDRVKFRPLMDSVAKYREYAAGRHTVVLTDQQKMILRGVISNSFCDNVCHQVISEAEGRLDFQGWTADDEATQQWLMDIYDAEQLDGRSPAVHYDSLRDGDTALAVGWDDDNDEDNPNGQGTVCLYRLPWWDGFAGVFIAYDARDRQLYAAYEYWDESTELKRRNIYFADRIEKYSSENGMDWIQYIEPGMLEDGGDGGVWPVAWTDLDGKALGIPVVHFPDSARGTGNYGFSEIGGGVMGFNDQINDLHFSMTGAGRLTAFQMLWASGIKLLNDPKFPGDPSKFLPPDIGPGQLLWSSDPASRFGHFPAGDMSQLIALLDTKLTAVARMTRTPRHAITGGDWPSGEALNRADRPAIGKALRHIKKYSSCWETVAKIMITVYNRYGKGGLNPQAEINAIFGSPEQLDMVAKSLVVQQMGDHISDQEALRLLGYTEEEAERIMDEKQDEAAVALQAQADAFNAGTAPGTQLPGRGPKPAAKPATKPGGD